MRLTTSVMVMFLQLTKIMDFVHFHPFCPLHVSSLYLPLPNYTPPLFPPFQTFLSLLCISISA
jgi:hypothetical protein